MAISDGWITLQVKGLDSLIQAMERFKRKGHMSDDLMEVWDAFEVSMDEPPLAHLTDHQIKDLIDTHMGSSLSLFAKEVIKAAQREYNGNTSSN